MKDAAQTEFETWQARMDALAETPMTPDVLDALPDDELGAVIDRKVWAAIGEEPADWDRRLRQLSPGKRMFCTTQLAEGEIDNGGFHQYFYNSSGEFAPDAVDGLLLIGAAEHAELLQRAMAVFLEESDLQGRIRRDGSLEAFLESYTETRLEPLASLWWDLSKRIGLESLRLRYVRAHLREFADE
jgi:hypothetical protein